MFFSLFRSRKKGADEEDDERPNAEMLLSRFVVDGKGRRVGESVSLAGDLLIVKSSGKYLGVPLKHVEENNESLLVKGLVDYDRAEQLGEKWREEAYSTLSDNENK